MSLISFAEPASTDSRRMTQTERIGAMVLVVAGFAVRAYASVHSWGIVHPDEHQQYLEQANRIAYGYGETYWEQARGMRSYLYPGLLAGCLLAFDACGITDPIHQAAGIRMILASASFLVLIALARRYYRDGQRVAAAFFLAWVALSPFMVFISVRALSETAVIGPFYLALLLIPRRPACAGLLLAVSFAIRFQAGILVAAVYGLLLAEGVLADGFCRRKMLRLTAGLCVGLLAVGWFDLVTLGSWFHSPVEYFRANISENGSAAFGVKPWHYYLDGYAGLLGAFPLAGVGLFLGAFREWRLAVVVLTYVAVHSAVGHKEGRFLWTLAPAAYLLSANGVQVLWDRLGHGARRLAAIAVLLFSVAWVEAISLPTIPWTRTAYRDSSVALAKVGSLPDVTGVAVCDTSRVIAGNYFFLRRPIPLLMQVGSWQVVRSLESDQRINYLVAEPDTVADFEKWHPREVDRLGGLGIYVLQRSPPTTP